MKSKKITAWILFMAMLVTMMPSSLVFAAGDTTTPTPYPIIVTDVFSEMTNDISGVDKGTDLDLTGTTNDSMPNVNTAAGTEATLDGITGTVYHNNRYYFYIDTTAPKAKFDLVELDKNVVSLFTVADVVTNRQQAIDMSASDDVTASVDVISGLEDATAGETEKNKLQEGRKGKEGEEEINLQMILSSHSSHIVSQSDFEKIKFFYRENDAIYSKNLSDLKTEMTSAGEDGESRFRFLKQYLTLERSELFFADKVIFVEGDTERILINAMMLKTDIASKDVKGYVPLMSQNISVVEVGAYSHVFDEFISYLGIKALIILYCMLYVFKNN